MKLIIGNKAYSSWSLRPWLLMRVMEIPFDDVVVPLATPDTTTTLLRYSPAAKVPVLIDGSLTIWDSLAIIEHLAETRPDIAIWPKDPAARALARSLAAEMHSSFAPLRKAFPMNFRRAPKPRDLDEETQAMVDDNLARIEAAWADARTRFGQDGPFLFGRFCAVDAMFAPLANRFHAYAIKVSPAAQAYMDAIMALPAWRDWQAGADAEGWRIDKFEVL